MRTTTRSRKGRRGRRRRSDFVPCCFSCLSVGIDMPTSIVELFSLVLFSRFFSYLNNFHD